MYWFTLLSLGAKNTDPEIKSNWRVMLAIVIAVFMAVIFLGIVFNFLAVSLS